MTEPTHATMESHPDILAMRERHTWAEQAATTPVVQAVEAISLITGLYLAASPWIVGFNGMMTLAVTNLITGVAYAVLMGGFGHAYERTHGMAWAAALLGVWAIIAPWVVSGSVATMRTIISNVIVGAVALVLALFASSRAKAKASTPGRGGSSARAGR
ncbi:SPW repeat protein [Streptomyces sp. NBS 14/10]|uniref:SPW repeat protein n=1 Tax=Streptomyces sp. NBS 14/10 TaxID=1945643 RepID=UPI0015C629A4|nr:SPW repeat protein [Streptomyces sp. NBS 14/10]KAK1183639.1 SPW repeat protein [Streptomyces sp. NBS 14/10]